MSAISPSGSPRRDPLYFERLPQELRQAIFSQLDYQSLIRLSSCKRFLRSTVDPQAIAHPTDKLAFVMRAEKDFARHWPRYAQGSERPGNFACYYCCRVRTPDYFEREQPHTFFVDREGRYWRDGGNGAGEDAGFAVKMARSSGGQVVSLRRFCIECGVHCGIYMPGDLLRTRTEQELWVCSCRKVWTKPACLKCEICKANCPFSSRRVS